MTLSAGTVSIGVKPETKGFGGLLHDGIMSESGAIGGIGKKLGGLIVGGLALAGVATGIGALIKTGFEEYSAADAITAQFAAGIKSTGNAANLSVKGMQDLASSISAYSGQSDESIGKTEQVLQTFTNLRNVGPNKIFDEATVAAANMAAKLGGDAAGSAIQLGKALNDPVKGMTALRRVGVAFTQSQTDQVKAMVASGNIMGAQKIILAELATEFGGAAEAAGKTLPGELARSKVAFGELSKAVLTGIMPVVAPAVGKIADAMLRVTPAVDAFSEHMRNAIEYVKGYVNGTGAVADVGKWEKPLMAISEIAITVGNIFKKASKGIHDSIEYIVGYVSGAGAKVDVGKWEGPLSAISEFIITLGAVAKAIFKELKPVLSAVGQMFSNLAPIFAPLIPQILSLVTSFSPFSLILKAIGPIMPSIVASLTTLGKVLGGALAAVLPLIVTLIGTLVKTLSGVFATILPLIVKEIGFLAAAFVLIVPVVGVLAHVIGNVLAAVLPVIGKLIEALVPVFEALMPPILQIVGVLATVLGPVLEVVGGILIALINIIVPILIPVVQVLGAIIGFVFQAIATVITWVGGIIQAIVAGIVLYVKVWAAIFTWLWETIIQPVANFIGNAINVVGSVIGTVFGSIGDVIRGAFNGVVDFVKGIFNTIAGLVNGIIDGVNGATSLAAGVGITIGKIPHIPKLAEGGIVPATPGGRLVRVAEGGQAEAIVPLSKMRSVGGGSGGGDTFNVYETVNPYATALQIARRQKAVSV